MSYERHCAESVLRQTKSLAGLDPHLDARLSGPKDIDGKKFAYWNVSVALEGVLDKTYIIPKKEESEKLKDDVIEGLESIIQKLKGE